MGIVARDTRKDQKRLAGEAPIPTRAPPLHPSHRERKYVSQGTLAETGPPESSMNRMEETTINL